MIKVHKGQGCHKVAKQVPKRRELQREERALWKGTTSNCGLARSCTYDETTHEARPEKHREEAGRTDSKDHKKQEKFMFSPARRKYLINICMTEQNPEVLL